ncbi:MAG TPA: hypothetical protein VKB28_22400 [Solirubrobacteraceae bacterium]|nr:hypothetical protein [Solirubrobacteraceae bacterium]
MLRGQSGQASGEYAGILAVVMIVFVALFASGLAPTVAGAASDAVCTIIGKGCDSGEDPGGGDGGGGPSEGPSPVDFDLPFPVLPFPGSMSVSCSYTSSSPGLCQDGPPGVSVGAEGSFEIERTDTTLDAEGCPTQTLSVTGRLELQTTASGETPVASGELKSYLGEATTYSVTVPSDAADAIESGDRSVPNPIDPRTIQAGESVELSQEFYAGNGQKGSYRALQLELGYDEGKRVSAGVSRVNPNTLRVYVGDEDFVRNALSLGIGNDAAGVALAAGAELSDGRLRSVDIDISTSAGWTAYQQFLKSGRLPRDGAAGTSDPTSSDVYEFTDKTQLEAHIGTLSIGGVLAESGATGVETTNADGSVDGSFVAHFNDAGVAVTTHTEPGGEPEPTRYSLLLENVSDGTIDTHEHVTGQQLAQGDDNKVRLDFTPEDFAEIQDQAFDQVMHRLEQNRIDISEDELRDVMEEYPNGGDPYGIDDSFSQAYEIAAAENPEQVLYHLYLGSGVGRDGDVGLQSLIDFMMATTAARHDIHDWPREHPDSLLPGSPVAPSCP